MSKMIKMLAASAAIFASIGAAQAADAVYTADEVAAPVLASAYNWSGFYAGVQAGWGRVDPRSTAANLIQPRSDGFVGGVHAGYNFQAGSFVFGAEADVSLATNERTVPCFNPAFNCSAGSDWNASIRAKAGVAMDRVLFYGTAGMAFMDYHGATTIVATGVNFPDRKTLTGWIAGGGVDFAVTDKAIAGVDILYSQFPTTTLNYDIPYTVRPTNLTVRAKFSYKF